MGFFKSTKGSIISDYFKALQDIGAIRTNDMTDVALYEDHLELKTMLTKQPITLQYEQITDVFYGRETEIIEKDKSVIGRAVVGGLLFGGVGAIVGGVSGTGKKDKKVSRFLFVISYKASSGEDAFLQFEDTRLYKGAKLAKQLKELCGLEDKAPEEVTSL